MPSVRDTATYCTKDFRCRIYNQTEPNSTGLNRAEPNQTELNRTQPSRAEPNRTAGTWHVLFRTAPIREIPPPEEPRFRTVKRPPH